MDRKANRGVRVGSVLLLLTALAPADVGALGRKKPYDAGDRIRITGRVTGADDVPIEGVSVLLEVSRTELHLLRWKRERTGFLQMPTATTADGTFNLEWRWDGYYDTFELVVALPVRRGGQETFQEFFRTDVTEKLMGGSPVVVSLQVADGDRLRTLKRFVDGLAGEDEQRIYQEMGLPDRVDFGKADYDPDSSWWYFKSGKVYRFKNGELERIEPFDPILPEP